MSIVQRYVLFGILYSVSLTSLFLCLFLFAFPVSHLSVLWQKEIGEVPFIIVVPTISVFVGAVTGGVTGYYWSK